jgi:hypothetical protein
MAIPARLSYPLRTALVGWAALSWLVSAGCQKKSTEGGSDGAAITKPLADARISTVPAGDTPPNKLLGDGAVSLDASIQVFNTCSKASDCTIAGACPADALAGCTCVTLPEGKACLPRCAANRDCPKSSETVLACSAAGLCIPQTQITINPGTLKPSPDASQTSDAVEGDAFAPDAL